MAQKVNPIAVRLRFNRSSDSSWFSDYYYSTLLYQDLNFRDYLSSIRQPNANKLGFRPGKCVIHHFPKRSLIHFFCLGSSSSSSLKKLDRQLLATVPSGEVATKRTNWPSITVEPFHPFLNWESSNIRNWEKNSSSSISQKKKALACYARQSYNFSKQSLNQLGDVFIESRTHELMREKGATGSSRPLGFLANLLELHKVATKCANGPLVLADARSVRPLGSTTSGVVRLGHRIFPGLRTCIPALQLKEQPDDKSIPLLPLSTWVNQRLTYSGWTSFALSQAFRLDGPYLKRKRATTLIMAKPSTLDFRAPRTSPTATSRKCSLISHLYFNYYAMHYFFLKKTNSLRDEKHINHAQARGATNFHLPLARSRYFYLSNVQSILSDKTSTFTSLRPIKVSSIFQSASLIAQEIACKLEQKKSFRQICRSIFQQISICKYIKGIRISCSGRLNGAEIAKSSCRKYGETSLHVFSDKIDYAQTKASTPYGILGVKVWISYV